MRYVLLLLLAGGCASPYGVAKKDYTDCLRKHLDRPYECEGYRRIWDVESRAKQIEVSASERPSAVTVERD